MISLEHSISLYITYYHYLTQYTFCLAIFPPIRHIHTSHNPLCYGPNMAARTPRTSVQGHRKSVLTNLRTQNTSQRWQFGVEPSSGHGLMTFWHRFGVIFLQLGDGLTLSQKGASASVIVAFQTIQFFRWKGVPFHWLTGLVDVFCKKTTFRKNKSIIELNFPPQNC